jgi:hypothetical protein
MAGVPGVGGQNRKTVEELKKTGSYRPCLHGDRDEVQELLFQWAPGVPEPPEGLNHDPALVGHWNYLHNTCPERLLVKADLGVMSSYCILTQQLLDSVVERERLPASFHTGYIGILRELGLTPSARQKLQDPAKLAGKKDEKPKEDGFEDLN